MAEALSVCVCGCVGASKIINGMNPLDVQREFYI